MSKSRAVYPVCAAANNRNSLPNRYFRRLDMNRLDLARVWTIAEVGHHRRNIWPEELCPIPWLQHAQQLGLERTRLIHWRVVPSGQRRQAHQYAFNSGAGLQATEGSSVMDQVEFHVAPASLAEIGAPGLHRAHLAAARQSGPRRQRVGIGSIWGPLPARVFRSGSAACQYSQ
jgi:hypothetical protein